VYLVFGVAMAHAAPGVNMRWTACFGDGGTFNRNFACTTNSGNHILVGSFELGQPISQVGGNEMTIDLAAASPTLPNWWAFRNSGTCRQTSLGINATLSPTAIACVDWANEQAGILINGYTIGSNGPSTARIAMASGVTAQSLVNLAANQEYFSFNLIINNAKTVGTGTCAGCSVPVCLKLASIKLVTPTPANNVLLSGPTNGTDSDFVTWQNGAGSCVAATPTRRGTWGEVKSLYR
jgi:hypothetical protein